MDWMQIVAALALVMFIVILFPAARHMIKNSPKGSSSEWTNFAMLMMFILVFIMLLINMV